MIQRKHREKAGDIFNRSEPVFGSKASFIEAFPSVVTANVDVEEKSYTQTWSTRLTEATAREFVDCNNPACYGGGVSVGSVLREMVRSKQSDATESAMCRGHEGTKTRKVRDCMHVFTVTAHLEFRDN